MSIVEPEETNQSAFPGLFTIGHSNHPLPDFVNLLVAQAVEVLVDVRTLPVSQYAPHFNGPSVAQAVRESGIRYTFYGRELGGRPSGANFYDNAGHVLYHRLAQSELFLDGVARIERGLGRYRVALMCSEENPYICHRRLLVTRVLNERGYTVHHLRGNGMIETETWGDWERYFFQREEEQQRQPALSFDEVGECEDIRVTEWKSIASVLRKRPPRTSSED